MPLEAGAKPGTPGFGRNVATEVEAGKPQKQAVAIAYSEAERKKSSDADDPDIAPAVVETEARALNRATEPNVALATASQERERSLPPVNQYEDPGFRNPTPDSARPAQVGPSLGAQNATNRAYWAGRR